MGLPPIKRMINDLDSKLTIYLLSLVALIWRTGSLARTYMVHAKRLSAAELLLTLATADRNDCNVS